MPVTVRNTDILFNDGTTQSTAAGGVPTAFGAVGTYAVLMMAVNTNLGVDGTIAGSSLRFNENSNSTSQSQSPGGFTPFYGNRFRFNVSSYDGGGSAVSGTWRKMSTGATYYAWNSGYGTEFYWQRALYVRIS
jgi:hypothetical protein